MKITKPFCVVLLLAMVLAGCAMDSIPDDTALSEDVIEARKGVLDKRAPGLYRGEEAVPDGPDPGAEGFLAAALAWLAANAESNGDYSIVLGADEAQEETLLYMGTLNGASPVSVAISGSGNRRILRLKGTGSLYGIREGVTLTAGAGITLEGVPGNYRPLIEVLEGGAFSMEDGSLLRGNTNTLSGSYADSYGGGVVVRAGGTCVINGGEINSCEAYYGGGVANTGGILVLKDGAIMSNVTRAGGGVYLRS